LKLLKRRAKDQNVQYIETMIGVVPLNIAKEAGTRLDKLNEQTSWDELALVLNAEFSLLENDAAVQTAVKDFVHKIDSVTEDLDDADFTLRAQAYVNRNDRPAAVFASMYSAFKTASQTKKLLVSISLDPKTLS